MKPENHFDLTGIVALTGGANRWGEADEMVGPVLLMASRASSYMTGQVCTIDGDTSIHMK